MPKKIDLVGKSFGRLIVVEQSGTDDRGEARWRCKCACGREKIAFGYNLRHGRTTSCGCYRTEISTTRLVKWSRDSVGRNRGSRSNNWKGGRKISKGYILILVGPGNKYRSEHDLVMERKLGRRLLPKETVHHKNGVRNQNNEDNLELWSKSHPPGQRVTDKVEWASELLRLYAPERLR